MSILAALQAKVDAVDSSTSMSEILKLMYTVKDHPYKSVYDSAGVMPLDSASIGSIRYADNRNAMYMLVGIDSGWKLIDSDASTEAAATFSIQGSSFGYSLGTGNGTNPAMTNEIHRYPYASDANATDLADMTAANQKNSGGASATHGYRHGGETSPGADLNTSDKFSYAAGTNSVALPNMLTTATTILGQKEAVSNGSFNYVFGGLAPVPGYDNVIQKGSTVTDAAFTDVGDLIQNGGNHGSGTSDVAGYAATAQNANSNIIQKVPFAVDGNSTDVGDAGGGQGGGGSNSSSTHGYLYGGYIATPPYASNAIHKYSFASDGNSTAVPATLPAGRSETMAGTQSTTFGYFHNANAYSTVRKMPFASEDTITDVGDIAPGLGTRFNASTQN